MFLFVLQSISDITALLASTGPCHRVWHTALCCHWHMPAGCCSPPQQWLHLSSIYACAALGHPLGRRKIINTLNIFLYFRRTKDIHWKHPLQALQQKELPDSPLHRLSAKWFPATNDLSSFCYPLKYCKSSYIKAFSSATVCFMDLGL